MIVPAGVKVHLALGYTDMRKGIDGLAMLVQGTLKTGSVLGPSVRLPRQEGVDPEDPVLGRKRAVPVHQAARPGRLRLAAMAGFEGSVTLTPAQLAMLIEGIDWRAPERVWRPALAG